MFFNGMVYFGFQAPSVNLSFKPLCWGLGIDIVWEEGLGRWVDVVVGPLSLGIDFGEAYFLVYRPFNTYGEKVWRDGKWWG